MTDKVEKHPLTCDECRGVGRCVRGYLGGDDNPTWENDSYPCWKCDATGRMPLTRRLTDLAGMLDSFANMRTLESWARTVKYVGAELRAIASAYEAGDAK